MKGISESKPQAPSRKRLKKDTSAIMGIQSYVIEAELAQEKAEHAEQLEFKKWKKKNE